MRHKKGDRSLNAMRFKVYLDEHFPNRDPFDMIDPISFLDEAVIFVDSKSYVDVVRKLNNIKRFMKSLDDVLNFLNDELNPRDVKFITISNTTGPIAEVFTNLKTGIITIVVSKELFYDKISNDYNWFFDQFKRIMDHELIHRLQGQKIDFSRIKPTYQDPNNLEKSLPVKHEVMAYAKNIINDLMDRYKTPEKVITLIQNPTLNLNKDLKMYIINFEMNSSTIKQLYKYMYEYLIGWE